MPEISHVSETSHARMTWMDTLRGIAVILVVVWHAVHTPSVILKIEPAWIFTLSAALAPYRVPTLFFLSGMLLSRSLSKPLPTYYWGKVRTIAWPYLVWMGIYLFLQGRFVALLDFQQWLTPSWLWYIASLALFYAVAPLLAKAPAWAVPLACWFGALLLSDVYWAEQALSAGFFFSGHAVWKYRDKLTRHASTPASLTIVAVSLMYGAAAAIWPEIQGTAWSLPINIVGIIGLIVIARQLSNGRDRFLAWAGRNSIVFYTAHYPAQLFVIRGLGKIQITDYWTNVGICLIVGLSISVVLALIREHFTPVNLLFELPRSRRSRSRFKTGS